MGVWRGAVSLSQQIARQYSSSASMGLPALSECGSRLRRHRAQGTFRPTWSYTPLVASWFLSCELWVSAPRTLACARAMCTPKFRRFCTVQSETPLTKPLQADICDEADEGPNSHKQLESGRGSTPFACPASMRASNQMRQPQSSQRMPHFRNTLVVLEVLQRRSPATLLELAAATRLSRGTIAAVVRHLEHRQLIEQDPRPSSPSGPSGGRPSNRLMLRRDTGVALSIDVGLRHVCVAKGNFAAHTTSRVASVDVTGDAASAIEAAVRLTQEVMVDSRPEDLIGVCVGLPAPIDQRRGQIASTAGISSWTGIRPADELRYRLGLAWQEVPFFLENDTNLVALAELQLNGTRSRNAEGQDVVLFVKWSDGIGGALLVDGELLTGDRGLAFELGHTPVGRPPVDSQPCERCGHVCLETLASGEAIVKDLSEGRTTEGQDFTAIVRKAVRSAGPDRAALQRAAKLIGEALGALSTLLNPRLVVISGRHFGEPPLDVEAYRVIADPLREGMRTTGLRCALEDVNLTLGRNSAHAAAEGGIVAAMRRMLPSYLERSI
jgi:predicted NBD/HSP70 family sugar kinase